MYEIDWACGYYDSFRQELYEGNLTLKDCELLHKEGKITDHQYCYALDYLQEEN